MLAVLLMELMAKSRSFAERAFSMPWSQVSLPRRNSSTPYSRHFQRTVCFKHNFSVYNHPFSSEQCCVADLLDKIRQQLLLVLSDSSSAHKISILVSILDFHFV